MELRELAQLRKLGQFDKITAWADGQDVALINCADRLLFIGEAYLKMGQLEKCEEYFKKALEDFEEELAVSNLLNIYKVQNDWEKLTGLADYLEAQVLFDDYMYLARFEAMRASGGAAKEQIEALKEYIDEFSNDELYHILLLEMLAGAEEFALLERYLNRFERSFANSEYKSEYVARLEEALQNQTKPSGGKSIQGLIYVPIYIKSARKDAKQEDPSVAGVGVAAPKAETAQKATLPEETSKEDKTQIKIVSITDLLKGDMFTKLKAKKVKNEEPPTMEERFENIVGMSEIRDKVGSVYRVLKMQMERDALDIKADMLSSTHFMIAGRRGSGKTLLARTIGKMLVDYGIRSSEVAVEIEAKDFLANYDRLNGHKDITLIVENLDRCRDSQGKFAEDFVWTLRRFLIDHKEDISVIMTGTRAAMEELLLVEQDIAGLVYPPNDIFCIGKYSVDELLAMMEILAKKKGWRIAEDAKELLKKQFSRESGMPTFADGKTLEERLSMAMTRAAERYAALEDVNDADAVTLEESDFEQDTVDASVEELLQQLDNMTGLAEVKAAVRKLVSDIMVAKSEEQFGGSGTLGGKSLHMVFRGGAGTGKTTVARIIGKIFIALGVLPGNKEGMVEVSAGDLIGQYVGESEEKAKKIFQRAMGGVLFIDEAYALCNNQFGKDVIDKVMLKNMEDHRDSIVVILAGYDEDMNRLLESNEGLKSRVQTHINFEDYSPEELYSIFRDMVSAKRRFLEKDTKDLVMELLRQGTMDPAFGNARGVRNLLDRVESAKSERITHMMSQGEVPGANDYDFIRREDFERVLAENNSGQKPLEELVAEIHAMEGMRDIKNLIDAMVNKVLAHETRKAKGLNSELELGTLHMIFTGGPGTGKTTMARKIGGIYKALGILPRGNQLIECDGKDLMADVVGGTKGIVAEKIRDAMGGILFIDEAYQLSRGGSATSYGQEAIDAMIKAMEDHRDSFMIILAGYTEEMKEFLDKNPGLGSRIPNTIEFKDYTPEELLNIFISMANEKGYEVVPEAKIPLRRLFERKLMEKDFGNARGARNLLGKAIESIDARIISNPDISAEDCMRVLPEDILKILGEDGEMGDERSIDAILEELNSMIGLGSVKKTVGTIVAEVRYNVWARDKGIAGNDDFGTLHLLFKGNAGTGKTTVARMLGNIYKQLGVLRTGQVVECGREDLVGRVVGDTAIKTREVVERARGGILFVDEAYTLNKGGNDFGQEALETIMKEMENHRDDLMVIFAGYAVEMDKLVATNQGVASRFPKQNVIMFEDYTLPELLEIFLIQAREKGMIIEEALYEDAQKLIESTRKATKNFGNARGIRNLVEAVDKRRKMRVLEMLSRNEDVNEEVAVTLRKEDFSLGTENKDD